MRGKTNGVGQSGAFGQRYTKRGRKGVAGAGRVDDLDRHARHFFDDAVRVDDQRSPAAPCYHQRAHAERL